MRENLNRYLKRIRDRLSAVFAGPFRALRWSWNWWTVWKTLPVFAWIRGAEEFRQGNFRKAAEEYQRGLKSFPKHKAAQCARLDYSYCLFRMGELTRAAEELTLLTRATSPLSDAFLLLARIFTATGKPALALSTLRRAIKIFPDDIQIAVQHAHAVMTVRESEAALDDVRKRLELLKGRLPLTDNFTNIVDGAIACFEVKFGDGALGEQLLSRVIATGAAPFEAILLRGETWLEERRILAARGLLERALQIAPSDPRPLHLLAKSHLYPGDFCEPAFAVQLAEAACRASNFEHPDSLLMLARAYSAADDPAGAELVLERVKSITTQQEINFDSLREVANQIERIRSLKIPSVS